MRIGTRLGVPISQAMDTPWIEGFGTTMRIVVGKMFQAFR